MSVPFGAIISLWISAILVRITPACAAENGGSTATTNVFVVKKTDATVARRGGFASTCVSSPGATTRARAATTRSWKGGSTIAHRRSSICSARRWAARRASRSRSPTAGGFVRYMRSPSLTERAFVSLAPEGIPGLIENKLPFRGEWCSATPRRPSWSRTGVAGDALDVVVHVELPRVRAESKLVDLVLPLVGEPRVDDVLGEYAPGEQEVVVGLQRREGLVERARNLRDLGEVL